MSQQLQLLGSRDVLTALNDEVARLLDAPDGLSSAYPIYVPSRSRAGLAKVPGRLGRGGLSYRLVVEPHQRDEYASCYPNAEIVVLPKDDQGDAYARNGAVAHATESGQAFHWQIDDNVTSFRLWSIDQAKYVQAPVGQILGLAETLADAVENVGAVTLGSLSFSRFACVRGRFVKQNVVQACCMLLRTGLDARFRAGVIPDVDYTLQLLKDEGLCTLTLLAAGYAKVQTGKMPGGAEREYANGGKERLLLALNDYWPGAGFRVVRKWQSQTPTLAYNHRLWRSVRYEPAPILRKPWTR